MFQKTHPPTPYLHATQFILLFSPFQSFGKITKSLQMCAFERIISSQNLFFSWIEYQQNCQIVILFYFVYSDILCHLFHSYHKILSSCGILLSISVSSRFIVSCPLYYILLFFSTWHELAWNTIHRSVCLNVNVQKFLNLHSILSLYNYFWAN